MLATATTETQHLLLDLERTCDNHGCWWIIYSALLRRSSRRSAAESAVFVVVLVPCCLLCACYRLLTPNYQGIPINVTSWEFPP